MSARTFRRARNREIERNANRERRLRNRSKAAIAAGGALGATVLFAPAAEAATIPVTSLADDGSGGTTLREAVIQANGNGEADVITFAAGLSGTIELVSDLEVVDEAVEIQGPGASQITVDGQDGDNVFYLFSFDEPDTPVTISGLTVTGGNDAAGGGIESRPGTDEAPALTLANVVITGNEASGKGGGLYTNYGSLTVLNSTISNNVAGNGGGGISTADTDGDQATELTIRNSTISGNSAGDGSSGGGGVYVYEQFSGSAVLIENSTFSGNSATDVNNGYGGGLVAFGDEVGDLTITGSTFAGNTAANGGGGVQLWGTAGSTLIQNSTFSGNAADTGANVSEYCCNGGGGISLYNQFDTPRTIRNTTVTGNSAAKGGGISHYPYDNPGEAGNDVVVISSTIVSGNTATDGGPDLSHLNTEVVNRDGALDIGFSLIGNPAGATINATGPNVTGVGAQLGPLAANGGPTQTHAPQPGSPAIDAGVANGLSTDQRGAPRTFDAANVTNAAGGDGTDIGSVELLPGGRLALAQCKGQAENVLFAPGTAIVGTDANDVIVGTGAADQVNAGKGADLVCAGGGNDNVKGAGGKDRVFGEAGKDRLGGNGGKDNVKGGGGKDTIKGGGGKDKLAGQAGADTLKGGGGADKLKGGGGKDKLIGGPGLDKLNGGGGKDSETQ